MGRKLRWKEKLSNNFAGTTKAAKDTIKHALEALSPRKSPSKRRRVEIPDGKENQVQNTPSGISLPNDSTFFATPTPTPSRNLARNFSTIPLQSRSLFGSFFTGTNSPATPDIKSTRLRFTLRDLVASDVPPVPACLSALTELADRECPPTLGTTRRAWMEDVPDDGSIRQFPTLSSSAPHLIETASLCNHDIDPDTRSLTSFVSDASDDHHADMHPNAESADSHEDIADLHQSSRDDGHMHEGRLREAPTIGTALAALDELDKIVHPHRKLHGKDAPGYAPMQLDEFTRLRINGMTAMLANYTGKLSRTYGHWAASSLQAAVSMRRGRYCARSLRRLVRAFIEDHEILPINPYGSWNTTLLENEDLAEEVKLHLQELGSDITAEKLVNFLSDPERKDKYGISRTISVFTAQRYIKSLNYRWTEAVKGQFVDGHDRKDVKDHRDKIYIPALKRLKQRIRIYDRNGQEIPSVIDGKPVIIWFHDESIFYAHDRRRKMWIHKEASAKPYRKGEGVSLMIADFVSAELGWLVSRDGTRRAREVFRPGKNRDGYFDNADIRKQAANAADILASDYPEYEHVFVYDNATTHRKRADDALSARNMPKNASAGLDTNWLVSRTVLNANGKPVIGADGKYVKEKVRMQDTINPATGEPQSFYFPDDDHQAGIFKGMVEILAERGVEREKLEGRGGLKAECKNFKCAEGATSCCVRRILFNEPDFAEVKSLLEMEMEARGIQVLFLPKFHCELNPIEQCWGYAKRLYRLNPESSKEDKLEEYALDALGRIPLVTIRRFFNRAFRFVDAYERGLSGRQAAWASRKYRGHRVLPETILDELEKAQIL